MCRWFAYVSEDEDCLLEDVLITPAHSLAKQVHDHYLPKLISHDPNNITTEHEITARNRLFNVDGFGVAWYTSARQDFQECNSKKPALYKTNRPPTNDANFHSICANTASTAVFAHIRAATATAVEPVNNHPFVFGRHTIMHNGVVSDFIKIKKDLVDLIDDDVFADVDGSTDSEHLAALYITLLTKRANESGPPAWDKQYPVEAMQKALHDTFMTIIELQQKNLGAKAEANSLNVCATDGQQLVAFRFRNHSVEQPPSLYYSTTAGQTLNRKYPDHPDGSDNPHAYKSVEEHGKHVIVASEPTTYKKAEWEVLPKNHGVIVGLNGAMKVEAVDLPDHLIAKAETTTQC